MGDAGGTAASKKLSWRDGGGVHYKDKKGCGGGGGGDFLKEQ